MGNRWDALRLAAALGVFFAHALALYQLRGLEPVPGHSLGALSVAVFFFISGNLVWQSWQRAPQWGVFWRKRLLRIFPGLAVAVLLTVGVLGWAVTKVSSAHYWQAPLTWLHLLNNLTALATVQTLPGVFESNPFARAVNGSLWTIRYELAMYALLALLGLAARGRRWVYPALAAGLALWWILATMPTGKAWMGTGLGDVLLWRDFAGLGVCFFLGSSFAAYAVRPRGWMALAALAAAGLAWTTPNDLVRQGAVWGMLAWGVFYVAYAGIAPAPEPTSAPSAPRGRVDVSYGVYIYAFPLQQAVTEWSLRHNQPLAVCVGVSLVLVLVLAGASWFGVERPCIRWGQRARS